MLSAMIEGSFASSPISLSAGGHDEQPCEVNNSTTARGSPAWAGRITATIAQRPSAPDHRDIELLLIVLVIRELVMLESRYHAAKRQVLTDQLWKPASPARHSLTDLPRTIGSDQPSNARRRPFHRPPPRHPL